MSDLKDPRVLFAAERMLQPLNPAKFRPGYAAKWGMLANLAVALLGIQLVAALYPGRD